MPIKVWRREIIHLCNFLPRPKIVRAHQDTSDDYERVYESIVWKETIKTDLIFNVLPPKHECMNDEHSRNNRLLWHTSKVGYAKSSHRSQP